MPFRSPFQLSLNEERELAAALLAAYDPTGLKDLGKELSLDGEYAGANELATARDLVSIAGRKGVVRRLLRIAGRQTNPELSACVREYLFRSFGDEHHLETLREYFDRLSPSNWDLLSELLRYHVGPDATANLAVPRWDPTPQSPTDFRSRCEELIEILCELPEQPDVAFRIPLLHFVRDVFCTPLGSELPELRPWLRRVAAKTGIKIVDLAIAGWGDPQRLAEMASNISDRLGMGVAVGAHPLPEGQPITWDLILRIPATKIAIVVDTPDRIVKPPAADSGVDGAGSRLVSPARVPGPSYSPVLVLSADEALSPQLHAEFAEQVPHSVLCLQSWDLDDTEIAQLKTAVTGTTQTAAPPLEESEGPIPELRGALEGDQLILIVGPSVSGAGRHTSGVRLAHELLTALEARFGTVHPLVPLDAAAYLYSVKRSREQMIEKVRGALSSQPDPLPKEYLNIARIFKLFPLTVPPRKQLIVTTNVDVLLERALLWEGVPFTRVIQAGQRTVSNRYDVEFDEGRNRYFLKGRPAIDLRPTKLSGCQQLENVIRIHSSDLARSKENARKPWEKDDPSLVLYKYHGSIDIPETVVLSISDYAQRTVEAAGSVPGDIRLAANNRRWLFVGYTLLDPQLRHLRLTLLTESQRADHVVLHCGLSADCLDIETLCIERLVWEEMGIRWKDELWAEPAGDDGCAFLEELVKEAS